MFDQFLVQVRQYRKRNPPFDVYNRNNRKCKENDRIRFDDVNRLILLDEVSLHTSRSALKCQLSPIYIYYSVI